MDFRKLLQKASLHLSWNDQINLKANNCLILSSLIYHSALSHSYSLFPTLCLSFLAPSLLLI